MEKVTYTDLITLIPARNLNDIQDAIIQNEEDISDLQTDVSELQTDVGNLQTGVENLQTDVGDIQGHAVFTAPTSDGTYTLKVTVENGTPTFSWVAEQEEATNESGS